MTVSSQTPPNLDKNEGTVLSWISVLRSLIQFCWWKRVPEISIPRKLFLDCLEYLSKSQAESQVHAMKDK